MKKGKYKSAYEIWDLNLVPIESALNSALGSLT